MQDIFSNTVEARYISETSAENRKKYAQFFTPYPIAKFMANWIMGGNRQVEKILDPAIGLGVFPRAILENESNRACEITGYDIDSDVLSKCAEIFADANLAKNIQLIDKDYLFHDWNQQYDGIICNPPYFKFQDYPTKDAALDNFQRHLGMNLSGFTNIYALFLLKSVTQLNAHGRCAYLIPSEFLNSDYGKAVKEYLIQLKSLRYILIFDFKNSVFDDALTTSCILLFANDNEKDGVEFINITSEQQLTDIAQPLAVYPKVSLSNQTIPFSDINPSVKWRCYYQTVHADSYHGLVPFSRYAKISRGIATGANDYFLFNPEKAQKFQIPADYLEAVISRANQVSGNFFNKDDFSNLATANKDVFLLNAKDDKSPAVNDYLALGESLKIDKKYLTSHRKPWYAIENRPAAAIWVSVFSRTGLRFIRNESGCKNLTTFHCVYPNGLTDAQTDLLFAYLLSDVSKAIFSDSRREYGGGLEKFEPNDLNNALVINLDSMDAEMQQQILAIYHPYRNSALTNQADSSLLAQLNKKFKNFMLSK